MNKRTVDRISRKKVEKMRRRKFERGWMSRRKLERMSMGKWRG
jgi:hypothetical protein